MTIGIYCIEHVESGKKYVGKSSDTDRRFREHKSTLMSTTYNKSCNRHLWCAVQKYGWEAFTTYVVEEFPEVNEGLIADREVYWMDFYKSLDRQFGYNLKRDSSGLCIVSEETRAKLSKANKGRVMTDEAKYKLSLSLKGRISPNKGIELAEETKHKISKTMTGRKLPEEHKRNMSIANLGEKSILFGKPKSEETREKISKSLSGSNHPNFGKHLSSETRMKISQANKGRVVTDEQRIKMSEASKGRTHTDETRLKISKIVKGRLKSEETKLKLSKANKGELNPSSVLTEQLVIEIIKKLKLGKAQSELAKEYGVSYGCIQGIKSGVTWKYLTNLTNYP